MRRVLPLKILVEVVISTPIDVDETLSFASFVRKDGGDDPEEYVARDNSVMTTILLVFDEMVSVSAFIRRDEDVVKVVAGTTRS